MPRRVSRRASAPRRHPLLAVGAFASVGLLFVGFSLPRGAVGSGELPAFADSSVVAPRAAQSLSVAADAVSVAPVRDSFEVMSYADQLRLKYSTAVYSATTGAIRWPFPYTVSMTDQYGWRAAGSSGSPFHKGLDFTPGEGTPIYAIADGVVTVAQNDAGGLGTHVIIQHEVGGQNIQSVYAHMLYGSTPLQVGDSIRVGDFLGLVGNTGQSYGAHLHLEILLDGVPIDPFAWLTANAVN